ncbi:hypothetical protein F4860DRAFT_499140 [Xylaria cubensis]|nr:hypothetical protein F4860DRAFT_499140 [Xylaria cubensis]
MSFHVRKNIKANNDELQQIGNRVSGQGIMYNIGNITINSNSGGETRTLKRLSPLEDLDEYLYGCPPEATPQPEVKPIFDHHSPESIVAFFEVYFPGLRALDGDLSRIIGQYAGPNVASVLQSLSPRDQNTLQLWAMSTNSQLLWVDGPLDAMTPRWTTDLALEVFSSATVALERQGTGDGAVLYHSCETDIQGRDRNADIIVKHLIFQLVLQQAKNFTTSVCSKSGLTKDQFLQVSQQGQFGDLWQLLMTCISVSDIRSLLIVISDLDCLSPGVTGQDDPGLQPLVDGLIQLSRIGSVRIKIMVTTKPSEITNIIESRTLETSRQIVLKLPIAPDRRRPPMPMTRVFRVPIRAKPSSLISEINKEEPSDADAVKKGSAVLNTFDDDSDSEIDFPSGSQNNPDLDDYLELDSDWSNDSVGGIVDEFRDATQAGRREGAIGTLGQGGQANPNPGVVVFAEDEDTDDAISYSDLEVGVSGKVERPTADESHKNSLEKFLEISDEDSE